MNSTEREYILFAVKKLFDKIQRGEVRFTDQVPQAVRELKAVRFDCSGEPIYETIGPLVRATARGVMAHDLGQEADERKRTSPVHELLGNPVAFTDATLRECAAKGSFSQLALELYKEAITVVAFCSHAYTDCTSNEGLLSRNQAVCAGLLVRIAKFMKAVESLVSQDPDRADVVFSLNRSITESATNLRFLVAKNEDRFFDQFVRFSLAPEREMYDVIQENIVARDGKKLPIEQRMLKSIDRVCRLSGVTITDIPRKMGDWGGGLRNRLIALGEGEGYAAQQRVPSHAVHGTWVDLVLHHLRDVDNGFQPDLTWSHVDTRLMLPICVLALNAARTYIDAFFPPLPELEPLLERIADLTDRIRTVDKAHEEWFNGQE